MKIPLIRGMVSSEIGWLLEVRISSETVKKTRANVKDAESYYKALEYTVQVEDSRKTGLLMGIVHPQIVLKREEMPGSKDFRESVIDGQLYMLKPRGFSNTPVLFEAGLVVSVYMLINKKKK